MTINRLSFNCSHDFPRLTDQFLINKIIINTYLPTLYLVSLNYLLQLLHIDLKFECNIYYYKIKWLGICLFVFNQ